MSGTPLLFLDANVLFSAALGGDVFNVLLELGERGQVRLVTSSTCELEARRNLRMKRPQDLASLDGVVRVVDVEDADAAPHVTWAKGLVQQHDVHVLASARALAVDVLLTGDTKHFGTLMERTDLSLKVRTPRAFLLEAIRGADT